MTDVVVSTHYTRPRLGGIILEALRRSGKDPNVLTPDDLASIDEFHIRGREASRELADLADIDVQTRVLDIGSGIGGPSRFLAATYGCHVTGIDLTEEFCKVATMLASRTGLIEKVSYQVGSALDLPFESASFDLAWMQHVSMNIGEKSALFGQIHRVLRPEGRMALYEIVAGNGAELHYPVPWARQSSISFMVSGEALRAAAMAAGLHASCWVDVTEKSLTWFRKMRASSPPEKSPGVGLQTLMGSDWPTMAGNMVRNLEEGRVAVVQAVLKRI